MKPCLHCWLQETFHQYITKQHYFPPFSPLEKRGQTRKGLQPSGRSSAGWAQALCSSEPLPALPQLGASAGTIPGTAEPPTPLPCHKLAALQAAHTASPSASSFLTLSQPPATVCCPTSALTPPASSSTNTGSLHSHLLARPFAPAQQPFPYLGSEV